MKSVDDLRIRCTPESRSFNMCIYQQVEPIVKNRLKVTNLLILKVVNNHDFQISQYVIVKIHCGNCIQVLVECSLSLNQ